MKAYDRFYELASGNFGLATASEAKELGISVRELRRWVESGRLESPARGVYRISNFPASQFDDFATAVESVGRDAYLYGESVLAMLNLTPTNPTWIYVSTPRRVRKHLPSNIVLCQDSDASNPEYYEGVRSQKVAKAIEAAQATVRPDRLLSAIDKGRRIGYVNDAEAKKLRKALRTP